MPPSIVVVIADDLCWGDLACHGNPVVRTPRLDALHAQSARLTHYCSGPLCTPARASLMTGRYHQRTRAIDTYLGRSMLDPDEVTIAALLRDAGYATGAFGKWHLGDAYPMRACDLGFESSLVHNAGGIGQPGDHRDNYARGRRSYFDPVLHRDGAPERAHGYCTDVFTDAAIDFVRENADRPFLCYLATNAPHTPLVVDDAWIAHYRAAGVNETHARLYGMVENIDHNVGRLLDAVADDTVVLFTSDHGPCPSARDFGATPGKQVRYNAGLRGEKGSLYQGGIKVPSFWKWGSRMPARDLAFVTSPIDVLPTLAAAAGAPAPMGVTIDGVDLLPSLLGGDPPDERAIFMQWHRGDSTVRYRNYAVIGDRWKLYRPDSPFDPSAHPSDELYDLAGDPSETTDVASVHPEVVAKMRALYEAWFDDVSSTRPDNFAAPRIRIGGGRESVLTRNDWRLDAAVADVGELGFSPDLDAHWELFVESEGSYDVVVRFDAVTGDPGSVCLLVGDGLHTRDWEPGVAAYEFSDVPLLRGPLELRAWAGDADAIGLTRQLGLAAHGESPRPRLRIGALYVDVRGR